MPTIAFPSVTGLRFLRQAIPLAALPKFGVYNPCSAIDCAFNTATSIYHSKMSSMPFNTPPGSPPVHRTLSERRAVTLAGQNTPPQTSWLCPRSFRSSGITPITSPCSSPPPTIPPSGYLREAKEALAKAIAKRNTKASTLSIDEDMRYMRHYYSLLGTDEREQFLLHLCTEHSTDHNAVHELAQHGPENVQAGAVVRWEERLRQALQPPHAWVLAQISRLDGGVKFLVDLRHDLLIAQSNAVMGSGCNSTLELGEIEAAALRELDTTLREMLSLWFTVGLLQLARITWESSCSMLQKISEYEAVHPVRNWTDLKRRVGMYRRCFVFTHSCMPNEPLVVLHTFLTDSISSSMNLIVKNPKFEQQDIVTPEDRLEASAPEVGEDLDSITAAVFYSITSTQKGLQGIELGNYLIKRVVQELQAENHKISMFSSLSPIPGYTKWLSAVLAKAARGDIRLFTDAELSLLGQVFSSSKTPSTPPGEEDTVNTTLSMDNSIGFHQSDFSDRNQSSIGGADGPTSVYQRLRKMLPINSWAQDPVLRAYLEKPLTRLCAYYLYKEKRRGYALNSVAHFHLKNGAVMWRINFEADMSPRGLTSSCGLMVNYRYFLQDSESNSRLYQEHQRVTADTSVTALAEQAASIMADGAGEKVSLPPPA